MSKKVKVNTSLLGMIQQIPTYAKFLRDLYTKKRTTNVPKKLFLVVNISSILSHFVLVKYKNSRSPTDSYNIGSTGLIGLAGFRSKCQLANLFSVSIVRVGRVILIG